MSIVPPLRLDFLNGWLLLVAYFMGLTLSALAFPPDKRKKLFLEPHYPRGHPRWIILALGWIAAIAFVALSGFIGLQVGTWVFCLGLALYALGYLVVMVSLAAYRRALPEALVADGLYRHSRNPQWLGLVAVFLGMALAEGGWLPLILVLILVVAYHFQILLEEKVCTSAYGQSYSDYMKRVPRYL